MKRNRNGISVSAAIIGLCALIIVVCVYFIWKYQVKLGAGLVLASLLLMIAVYHRLQTKHAVLRNFPLLGSLRYGFEKIRPEIRQYFFESDLDGKPFNRRQRSIVYQRAKNEKQTVAFGMQDDPSAIGFEWLSHSIYPVHVDPGQLRVQVGNGQCAQPYNASILNISAMSYGALSKTAIEALNLGAKLGKFAHNTGEGGISNYHLAGGDLIWQIGTGYFGCRDMEGRFDPQLYRNNALRPEVKMIELKLSQGAKPGHGGILPAQKNTPEIAAIRNVEPGTTVHSPARHSAFSDASSLIDFIEALRNLSDGKPVGFKLCVGDIREFEEICKAMMRKKIYPDFITVDGAEGGTGAAPLEFTDHLGMPLYDALAQVSQLLNNMGLKQHIRIFAAGRIITGFDIIKALSLGADAVYSARGMMMALGCIQALQCDSGKCPVGVATQQPNLFKGLDVTDKKVRVANFHGNTLKAVAELMEACGIEHAGAIHPSRIHRRIRVDLTRTFEEIYFNGSWQDTAPVSGISLHYN
jgi:glutamate synthase domain-containing protein 2